jgi:TusA-related sulfurtransferase
MPSRPSGPSSGQVTCERTVNQIEVDARGLRCPLPVIHLAAAARDAPAGTRIVVLASDPAARYDVPAWCRMRAHEMCEITEVCDPSDMEEGSAEGARPAYLRFLVVVRPQPSKGAGTGNESERPSRAT